MKILSQNGKKIIKMSKAEFAKISEKYDLSKEAGVRDWISGVGGGVKDAFKGLGEKGNISSVIGDTHKIVDSITSMMNRVSKSYENSTNQYYKNIYKNLNIVLAGMKQTWNQQTVQLGLAKAPPKDVAQTTKPAPQPVAAAPAPATTTVPAPTASGIAQNVGNSVMENKAPIATPKNQPSVRKDPKSGRWVSLKQPVTMQANDELNNKLSIVLAEKLKK